MGDPIKDLHQQMLENDLLQGENVNYENFRNSVFAQGGAERLYSVLKKHGAADMSLNEFVTNINDLKKKEPGGSEQQVGQSPSLSTQKENADAPTATGNSTSDFFENSIGAQDFQQNAKDLGVPDGQMTAQQPTTEVPGLTEADLMKQGMGGISAESTSQNIIPKPIEAPTEFTGAEDPLQVGKEFMRKKHQNFAQKEINASKSALRQGTFDLDVLGKTSTIAQNQAYNASVKLEQKFGPDWSEFLVKAGQTIENPPANLSEMDVDGLKYRFNQIVEDPSYKHYVGGLQLAQKAKQQFDGYAKSNPEYAQRLAEMETNKKAIDNTIAGSAWNWSTRKIAQVVGGIASIPRTLIGAIPGPKVQPGSMIANALGDWADQLLEFENVNFPMPDKYERPIWEKSAPYKDLDVVVDQKGNPIKAYKDGSLIKMTTDQIKDFVDSGAAKNAKNRFTGVYNAGFKLADVVADLYVMRWLGGGTKLGAAASAFSLQHRQNYEEAQRDLNLDDTQASQFALTKTALNSVLEAYMGDIESVGPKFAAAKAVGLKEAKALAGKMSGYDLAKVAFKPVLHEVKGELKEEYSQMFGDIASNAVFNGVYGSHLDTDISPEDAAETFLLTTLTTALVGGGDAMRRGVNDFTQSAMLAAVQIPEAMQKAFSVLQENGALNEEDVAKGMTRVNQMSDIYNRLPSDMSEENKAKVALLEWKKMANQVAYGDSPSTAQQKILKDENKAADEEIQAIMAPAEVVQQETPVVEAAPEAAPQKELKAEEIFVSPTTKQDFVGERRVVPLAEREGTPNINEVAPDSRTMFADVAQAYTPETTDLSAQIEQQKKVVDTTIGDERMAAENELNRLQREQSASIETQQKHQESLVDDTVNVALSSVTKTMRDEMTPSDHAAFRDYVAENLADPNFKEANADESFHRVANNLINEFISDNRRGGSATKNIKRSFNPQTTQDHIADAFAAGTRISSAALSADIPAEMQDPSVRMHYSAKNGASIEDLAEQIWTQMNSGNKDQVAGTDVMSTSAAIDMKNEILDFIRSNPKGPIQHMKNSMAAQNQDAAERWAGPEHTPEQVAQEVEKQQESLDQLSSADISSIEKALAPYGEGENFDADAFIRDYDAWDPFSNQIPHFQQMTPQAHDKINEIRQQIGEQTGSNKPEVQGQGENQAADGAGAGSATQIEGSETAASASDVASLGGTVDNPALKDVESTAKALDDKYVELLNSGKESFFWAIDRLIPENDNGSGGRNASEQISDAYHKAKADGSNPELVKAVESLLSKEQSVAAPASDVASLEQQVQNATGTAELTDLSNKIDEEMQEAPLPDELTPEYLAEMVRSGIIDNLTYTKSLNYLQGDRDVETQAAYDKAMSLREKLRDEPKDKVLPESLPKTNDKLNRPTVTVLPDGSFVVSDAGHYADALREAGAIYDPISQTWTMAADKKIELDAALSERRADGLDHAQDVRNEKVDGEVGGLLTRAAATLRRYRNRARFKKAATFQEQLDAAKALHGMSKNEMDKATRRVFERIRRAFPNVTVVTNTEEIDAVKDEMVASGEIPNTEAMGQVMGFERNGKVYIDPRVARPDTPVHEFGHIWNSWMRKNQPTLYAKGIDLVKQSNYFTDVLENPAYAHLSEEEKAEEALAQAIGEKGAFITNSTVLVKFKRWLSDMWSSIQRAIGFNPQDMTLEQYVNRQAVLLTGGKTLLKETSEDVRQMKDEIGEMAKFQIIGERGAARAGRMEDKMIADKMEQDGATPDEIWAATGWERGRDGKWRSEIPYGNVNAGNLLQGGPWSLSDIFDAPRLYKAYPELKNIQVVVNDSLNPGQGSFDGKQIEVSSADLGDVEKLNNIMVHEIQHAVQNIEGFDQGANTGVGRKISPEVDAALSNIVSMEMNGSPESMAKYFEEHPEVEELLDDIGELQDFKNLAVLSTDEINSALKQDQEASIIEYASAPGEIEARNAEARRTGTNAPISATEDIGRNVMAANFEAAKSMQEAGMPDEKIYAATGWYQNDVGEWKFRPIQRTYVRQERFPESSYTVGEIFDAPDFFAQYPELKNHTVRFMDQSNMEIRDGEIILPLQYQNGISTVMASMILRGAAQVESNVTAMPMAKSSDPVGNVEQAVMTNQKPRFAAAPQVTASYHARMISAKNILKDQLKKEGLKNMDAKIAQAASDLGLDESDLKRAVEAMALRMGYGTLRIDKGEMLDARSKVRKFMDRYNKRFAKWWQKNLTTRGLMTIDLYAANERRIGRAAAKIYRGEQYIRELESAMKEAYGKDLNDTHWRMVDNVLRGTGDWTVLPPAVGDALRKIRELQDSVSLDLLQSGIAGGEMIVTVLQNAGIDVDAADLENYQGVDLTKALGKLPFERTAEEVDAIRDFLNQHKGAIGTYLYRSYKVHDTKDWEKYKDSLDPRVLQEARDFLQKQAEDQIKQIEQDQIMRLDEIDDQIQAQKDKIADAIANLDQKISDAQDKINDILAKQAAFVANKGVPNKSLDNSLVSWQQRLADFKKRAKAARDMEIEDFAVVDALTNADIVGLPIAVKKIVGARKAIAELYQKQSKVVENNQAKIDVLTHTLNNIEAELNSILYTDDSPVSMLSRGKLGSKDLNSFRQRKDIAPEIRELMGEYHDPRLNFAKSLYRAVNALENQLFLTDLRESQMGNLFFKQPTGDAVAQISSEGNRTLDPLNGLYTTPEIKEVFEEYYQGKGMQDPFWRAYTQLSASVKYGKTILSPVTHVRNFVSNLWFAVNNAYDIRHGSKAFKSFVEAFGKKLPADQAAYFERLTELRLLGNGANIGSINSLMDAMNADAVDAWTEKYLGGGLNAVKKGAEALYGAEDDFFRVLAFETEKARYAKALYGNSFDNLSKSEQTAVEERAAELTIAMLPTYSKVPKIVKNIQLFPFVGTFVAFPAEMFRVTYNQLAITRQELKDPRLRHIGVRRLIGMGIAQGLMGVGLTALGKWFAGVTKEEEDAARYFMFDWQKRASLIWQKLDGKEMAFINLSYTDPYSFLKKPIIQLATKSNNSFAQDMASAAYSFVEPFLSPELTANTIDQVINNKSDRNKDNIYNERKGWLGDWYRLGQFIGSNLQPGIIKFGLDVYSAIAQEGVGDRPPKQLQDVLLGLAGMQTERRNMEQAVSSKFKELKQQKEYSREIFTDDRWKYKKDVEKLKSLYEDANKEYNEVLKEAKFALDSAQKAGLSKAEAIALLEKNNFSKDEIRAIITGRNIQALFKDYNK